MATENQKPIEEQIEAILEALSALNKKYEQNAANIAALEKFTDGNDEKLREALATMQAELNGEWREVRQLLWGAPNLRLVGIADRLERAEKTIEQHEDQRKAQQTTIRTLQAVAALTGSTLLGTLGTIIAQYFQ